MIPVVPWMGWAYIGLLGLMLVYLVWSMVIEWWKRRDDDMEREALLRRLDQWLGRWERDKTVYKDVYKEPAELLLAAREWIGRVRR